MTQPLTDGQVLHRQYLCSPVWRQKREEALEHYGCQCNRCGEYGNDVHHKTYERVGGQELMEDLEILCRECHSTHHIVDKIVRTKGVRKHLTPRAIFQYLSRKQKDKLKIEFNIETDGVLHLRLICNIQPLLYEAQKILGIEGQDITHREEQDSWTKKLVKYNGHNDKRGKTKHGIGGNGWIALKNIEYDDSKGVVIKSSNLTSKIRSEDLPDPKTLKWPSWIWRTFPQQ